MAILADIAGAILASWKTFLLAFLIFTPLEFLTQREDQSLAARLPGLAFWSLWLPASMLIHDGFQTLWGWLGVRPLIVLPMDFDAWGVLASAGSAVIAAIVYDFFFYWCHRFEHRHLWRFHAVHHSIRELNTINAYHHFTEPVVQSLLILLPLSLIVYDIGVVPMAMIVLLFLQTSFIHSPTRLSIGPLSRVIVDNRFHRIHHSLDERHFDRNFGAFTTIWDHLFGTAWVPEKHDWPAVGIDGVPPPKGIADWLAFPWRRFPAADDARASEPATPATGNPQAI